MDHKKSPTSRRTKRQSKALEENYWDCSVCTYRNTAEAFKCLMCDIRKGTSTRKPRINPQLVAQQVAQQFNPTPAKTHKREKSDKKSLNERRSSKRKNHLRKLKNVDRNSAETREVTVNNITVMITEYKPKPAKKLVSDQSGQSSRASSESESSSEAPSAAADSDSRSSLLKLKVEQKLVKTANRIKKTRENVEIARKEESEFNEIRKLLNEHGDYDDSFSSPVSTLPIIPDLESSSIPLSTPLLNVFNEDLLFSLFDAETLCLSDFVVENEKCLISKESNLLPSEETFRSLLSSRSLENLLPEESQFPFVGLYVLHLMSVHENSDFVSACFDFLVNRPFRIEPEQIFPIFHNYGAEARNFVSYSIAGSACEKSTGKRKFPHRNLEMVGKILLGFVAKGRLVFTPEIGSLVGLFVRMSLDRRLRSGPSYPIYSTLFAVICLEAGRRGKFDSWEMADWLDLKCEHYFVRLEICRTATKRICRDLHDILVLKTISDFLNCDDLPVGPSIEAETVKAILMKLNEKEFLAVEFYSVLQLVNGSLPGIDATVEESLEIESALLSLDRKIGQTEDSIDLVRLQLEIAKIRNWSSKRTSNRK